MIMSSVACLILSGGLYPAYAVHNRLTGTSIDNTGVVDQG